MVSRRKILSRSRDDLNLEAPPEEEEDIWYNRDKLYKDHIQEVLNKWQSIDDEIWAKIIVLERNRRVAKAYARAPVLTVNGSDDGFDGFRIGLAGFDNPMRDAKTEEVKRHIGQGCKIKMDDSGNILIKRIAKANVFVKTPESENAVSNEIVKLPSGSLELDKPVKLFDMKKFQQNVARELKRAYPDRRKLECQCISAVAFVKNESDILEQPCWVMLINIVAMDMLKSKIPPGMSVKNERPVDIRNRPRIPVPDEDPYSVAGSGSSGSSGVRERSKDKPPKLPPRDSIYGSHNIPKPDYEQQLMDESRFRQQLEARNKSNKKNEKRHDDPYYCGLRARIPNFAKSKAQKEREKESKYAGIGAMRDIGGIGGHHLVWGGHQRGYMDNVAKGVNMQAPANHPDPIYAGFARPFERNPTTRVAPTQQHRGGKLSHTNTTK